MQQQSYAASIEHWRAQKDAELRAENGWLALIGLFWLEEGPNRFGAGEDNEIVLPSGASPSDAGSFELHGGAVTLQPAEGAGITVNGEPAIEQRLRSDADGRPDVVALGSLTMQIIRRGERLAVRARDRESPARRAFAGRQWYPIDEAYCVDATFIAHARPTIIPIQTILDTIEERESPGALSFVLGGVEYRLDALVEGDQLFMIFRDGTSGDTTYPAGRYLKTSLPQDGHVTLDFNRAYSPPCAFTAFATCPLPPPQNRLALRVEAGERYESHL
jgi:uncharacterized protein (DUF1684 family)